MTPQHSSSINLRPRVAVVGMGYVGAVSAAALAAQGCRVVGVEMHPRKLAQLQAGIAPVSEPHLSELIAAATEAGTLRATDDLAGAVSDAELVLVCVGTPSAEDGTVDLGAIDRVTEQLAEALAGRTESCVVLIRSTVPPGTTRQRIAPVLKRASSAVAVGHHPEFLREGSALADWKRPPMIVWGADAPDEQAVTEAIQRMYLGVAAVQSALATTESELLKYACNVFHAVKINFANEIGTLAAACGADARKVMETFCLDRRLNISKAYFRPGFAFGGSCLPKDTRALLALARQQQVELPLAGAVLASNGAHLERAVRRVLDVGRQPTLLLGLSFKAGTDDLRESPMVELAERLLGKGIPLAIFDPDLIPSRLVGANAAYIQQRLPHLHLLLREELPAALRDVRTVVKAKPVGELDPALLRGKTLIDLTDSAAWGVKLREQPQTAAA